jgi:hypothetical protein
MTFYSCRLSFFNELFTDRKMIEKIHMHCLTHGKTLGKKLSIYRLIISVLLAGGQWSRLIKYLNKSKVLPECIG